MTNNGLNEHYDSLRDWARGLLPLEAATELLIRAGYAQPDRPWIRFDDDGNWPHVLFAEIPELIGGMSGGEKRVLRIAASLGADQDRPVRISLEDDLPGLDRSVAALVLAAIAHAAGVSTPGRTVNVVDGAARIVDVEALYTWPAAAKAGE